MPIPPGEIQRLRDEERRREAVHRRIKGEHRRRKLLWIAAIILVLTVLVLIGSQVVPLLGVLG